MGNFFCHQYTLFYELNTFKLYQRYRLAYTSFYEYPQYVGRIQRDYKGKEEVKVIDYIDTKIPMLLRMFNKREKGYRALGFFDNDQSTWQNSLI